jgi:hypothetical protein
MRLLLLLLTPALLFSNFSNGQGVKYKHYNYEWDNKNPVPIAVSDQFKNEDAVILSEQCVYNQSGNKGPGNMDVTVNANYYFFTESFETKVPVIQKHMHIKYLTEAGIKKHSSFILPETFDQTFDQSNVRPQWRDSIFRPVGEFDCIRYFAARIIKSDGTLKDATVSNRINTLVLRGNNSNENYYNWIFTITNLEPGDELDIDYSYEGTDNYGRANRIFFNSDLPKQTEDLTLRFAEKSTHIFTYHNGGSPKDSVMTTPTLPHYTEYYFHFENLPGGINDPGGRPYMSMPFVSFYTHNLDFGIMDEHSKVVTSPLPYPWWYSMLPLVGYRYQDLQVRLGRKDNSTVAMNQYVEECRSKTQDTSVAAVIAVAQHDVAENFEYRYDEGYTNGREPELEQLGKYISGKILRESSRLRFYDEMLMRLDNQYYNTLLMDKRIGRMDIDRYEGVNGTRFGVAVPYKNTVMHFYPKSSRFGYEAGELPFYYEDVATILIPQAEEWSKKFLLVPNVNFAFVRTPLSGINDNVRNTAGMATISLDSMTVQVTANIRLAGQFSTLTRGYYQYGCVDTTINIGYYNTIDQLADDQKLVKPIITPVNKQFPFETTVKENFTASKKLKKNSDSEFSIDLSTWFNQITENGFSPKRSLDFFPDFQSQDVHKFMIHFDHKVQVAQLDKLQKNIENDFGIFELKATQPSPNDILLQSNYTIKAAVVPAAKAQQVADIYEAIASAKTMKLAVRKVD